MLDKNRFTSGAPECFVGWSPRRANKHLFVSYENREGRRERVNTVLGAPEVRFPESWSAELPVQIVHTYLHTMSMFINFPEVITGLVLSTWLNFPDLAWLDAAFCNRKRRKAFLASVYAKGIKYSFPDNIFNALDARTAILNEWLMQRCVGVSGMHVTHAVTVKKFMPVLEKHGINLTWVSLKHSDAIGGGKFDFSSVLFALGEHCPNIAHLHCADNFTHKDYQHVAGWPKLQHLVLSVHATKECLRVLAEGCRSITKLTLPGRHTHLSPEAVTRLFELPRLQALDICDNARHPLISDHSLTQLARRCPKLKSLHIQTHIRLTAWTALAQHCTALEDLDLKQSTMFPGDNYFFNYLKRLGARGGLRSLAIPWRRLAAGDVLTEIIRTCTVLRVLRIPGTDVNDAFLEVVSLCCPQLEVLEVTGTKVTAPAVRVVLQRCKHLKRLQINYNRVSRERKARFKANFYHVVLELDNQW